MDIISGSIPGDLRYSEQEGCYALLYNSKESCSADDIQNEVNEKIAVINGISWLILNENPGIRIESVRPAGKAAEDFLNTPTDGNGGIIISCDDDEDEEVTIRSPFESVFLVASADNCVNAVMQAVGTDFKTWGGFLKIYKKIESSTGAPAAKGWCSDDEQSWFLDSAEAYVSQKTGDEIELFNLMYLSEAESFLTIILQEMLKEKKLELKI
ncbi:MAG: hypothetical protein JW931_02185 [Methanomicrobiaceae archaeon]|nr:hypothetical protein [Methanomicrobiaceae archaeon]